MHFLPFSTDHSLPSTQTQIRGVYVCVCVCTCIRDYEVKEWGRNKICKIYSSQAHDSTKQINAVGYFRGSRWTEISLPSPCAQKRQGPFLPCNCSAYKTHCNDFFRMNLKLIWFPCNLSYFYLSANCLFKNKNKGSYDMHATTFYTWGWKTGYAGG